MKRIKDMSKSELEKLAGSKLSKKDYLLIKFLGDDVLKSIEDSHNKDSIQGTARSIITKRSV